MVVACKKEVLDVNLLFSAKGENRIFYYNDIVRVVIEV